MSELRDWMNENGVTQSAFAKMLPVNPRTQKPLTQGAISQWLQSVVPAEWVVDVHRVTGLPMSTLNPRFAAVEMRRESAA